MALAIVDIDAGRIVSVGGLRLVGACLRCGECCKALECKHLVQDQTATDGSRPYRCDIYFTRPHRCAFWPMPDEVRENCGFHYEVVS